MTKFQVSLQFQVRYHDCDDWRTTADEKKAKKAAFRRTEKYYEDHDIIAHIKSNDAMGMVEYILCEGEVLSAEWDPTKFAIHMIVDTDESAESLKQELEMHSLEDGEYEACCETGWTLFTRGPQGEVYDGDWKNKDVWEYALVDYRDLPIVIHEIKPQDS